MNTQSKTTEEQVKELMLMIENNKKEILRLEEVKKQEDLQSKQEYVVIQKRTEAKLKYAIDYKQKKLQSYTDMVKKLKEEYTLNLKTLNDKAKENQSDLNNLMEINLEVDDADEFLDDMLPISVVNEITKQFPFKTKQTIKSPVVSSATSSSNTKPSSSKKTNNNKNRDDIRCYYPDKLVLRANAPFKDAPHKRCIMEVVWCKDQEIWIDRHTMQEYRRLNQGNIAWSKERGYKPTNAWKDFRALNMETGKTKSMMWGAGDPVPEWITDPVLVRDYVDDLFVFP